MAGSTGSGWIHGGNVAYLSLVIVGLPLATSVRIGSLVMSSANLSPRLLMAALILGASINLGLALRRKARPSRRACRFWMFLYLGVLLVQWLTLQEVVGFRWLKILLEWIGEQI